MPKIIKTFDLVPKKNFRSSDHFFNTFNLVKKKHFWSSEIRSTDPLSLFLCLFVAIIIYFGLCCHPSTICCHSTLKGLDKGGGISTIYFCFVQLSFWSSLTLIIKHNINCTKSTAQIMFKKRFTLWWVKCSSSQINWILMVVEQKFFDLICRTNSIRTSHRLSGVPLNKFFSLKHVSSGRPKPTLEPKPKGLKFRFVKDETETETKS